MTDSASFGTEQWWQRQWKIILAEALPQFHEVRELRENKWARIHWCPSNRLFFENSIVAILSGYQCAFLTICGSAGSGDSRWQLWWPNLPCLVGYRFHCSAIPSDVNKAWPFPWTDSTKARTRRVSPSEPSGIEIQIDHSRLRLSERTYNTQSWQWPVSRW